MQMRAVRTWASASAVVALGALALSAPSASGEVGDRPIALEPVEEQSEPGGVGPQAVPTGRSYKCAEAGTLRRKWQSYVIGWCTVGMHIDISSGEVQGWQAGWGEGSFQHCGWFLTSHPLVQEGIYDHNCGTNRYPESYFATAVNISPSNDGAEVPIYNSCTRYLNVRPWLTASGTPGYDSVGTIQTTDKFFWRYRSRNNRWVLGRMERPGTSVYYNWTFVHSSCVGVPPTRAPYTTVD